MKALILMMLVSLSCHAISIKKETKSHKMETKTTTTKTTTKSVHPALKKEEDCDDKAKKPIEIKPETISLSGNRGCTLPE